MATKQTDKTAETKDVATSHPTGMLATGEVPDHVKNATGAGNENVSTTDMAIPRIKLLQDLSPELKKSKAEYVEGAESGHMFNTVTKELFNEFYAINLVFDHEFAVFRDRDFGGGFEGSFETRAEAVEFTMAQAGNAEQAEKIYNIVETGRHTIAIVDPETMRLFPAIMDMSSTKLAVSNQWNTDLNRLGGDRFSSLWKVEAVEQEKKNNTFFNYKVTFVGWASDELYTEAKEKYEQISSVRKAYASKQQEKAE